MGSSTPGTLNAMGRDGWRANPQLAALWHLGGPAFTATFTAEGLRAPFTSNP